MKLENVIYCGDNLAWLKKFPDSCIDLIYIDPPFFSNKKYEIIFNDGEEIRSFEDRWRGGINHYIEWMKIRIFEMHRILADTGSFYLHCDWHASHYLKVMCDEIFGYGNFRNEIVWCYTGPSRNKKDFPKKHDNIFRYAKGEDFTFNLDSIRKPYSESFLTRRESKEGSGKGIFIGEQPQGRDKYSKGKLYEDWWDDIPTGGQISRKELLGYPTQKPEALMERIIKASSNIGDLVCDPFCGCGTTIAIAQVLQRKWIGIDVSPTACKLMKNRVEKAGAIGTEIVGLPIKIEDLKKLLPFEFQNWCVGALGGTVNSKKVGDMGIDGFTFMYRNPIQIKQSENIGRNVVDNFETAMQRIKKDEGYIVAFSFGKGAYEEVARVKQDGLFIKLLAVDKLLEFKEDARQGKIL